MGEGAGKTWWVWRTCGWTLRIAAALAVIAILVAFGARQMRGKILIAKPIQFIGHADDAAYAAMGVSLAEGRGLDVDYVSTFFIPYPAGITHREDHWPPFMGFSIAPCVWLWGKAAWVAKLPAMFYASIGLPLTTALLGYALSRRGFVAVAAGLLMMINPFMYEQSMRTLADVATAMLVAGFCGSIILARRWKWMHLVAGAFVAGAFYAKGSEIALFALYPVVAMLACGLGVVKRGWFYGGLATAVLLAAPFWYSSWKLYGNPLHSTQNYVSSFYGFEDWDQGMYGIYWGHDLPKPSDRWTKHGGLEKANSLYTREAHLQMGEIAQYVLTGGEGSADVWQDFGSWGDRPRSWLLGPTWRSFAQISARTVNRPMKPVDQWATPEWELAGVGAYGLFWFMVMTLPVVWGIELWRWWRGRKRVGVGKRKAIPWMVGPVLAIVVVIGFHWVFLAYMWQVMPRFCLPIMPLLAVLGATAFSRVFEWPLWGLGIAVRGGITAIWRREPKWIGNTLGVLSYWHVVLTLGLVGWMYWHFDPLYNEGMSYTQEHLNEGAGFVEQPRFVITGKWIKKNLPSAIVMCRNPWELQYYMGPGNKSICLPYPMDQEHLGAEQIFAIARYYGVTHFLLDDMRPAMEPWLDHVKPGFERVPGAPDSLYAIDWSKIPTKSVDEVFGKNFVGGK